VLIEMAYIALIGTVSGILISMPVIIYFLYHPIRLTGQTAKMMENYGMEPVMPVAFIPDYFFGQSLIILVILSVVLIYPISRILHLNLIKALRR
jgi:ABC-type antimicrobial peptide transport system permease subunit